MSPEPTRYAADVWFIWTKTGRAPRFAHATREAAETEAKRLAAKLPGKTFIVMHAQAKYRVDLPVAAEAEAEQVAA